MNSLRDCLWKVLIKLKVKSNAVVCFESSLVKKKKRKPVMQDSGVNGKDEEDEEDKEEEGGVIWVHAGAPPHLCPLAYLCIICGVKPNSSRRRWVCKWSSRQNASIHESIQESIHESIHGSTHPVGRENDENIMCFSDEKKWIRLLNWWSIILPDRGTRLLNLLLAVIPRTGGEV